MVAPLPAPRRPLTGGRDWTWQWRVPTARRPWAWCRIYHRSAHTPDGTTHRKYGPLHRLDHHLPTAEGQPQLSTDGRSVLYVARNLVTAFGEVFGDYPEARVCPNYRVALIRPTTPLRLLDLRGQDAAMRIGALPSLATGDYPRARTQEWARAIYEDQPVAGGTVRGVYYNAAHTNGPALALWDTTDDIEAVRDRQGVAQDLALTDPRIWSRVIAAAAGLRISADLQTSCSCA